MSFLFKCTKMRSMSKLPILSMSCVSHCAKLSTLLLKRCSSHASRVLNLFCVLSCTDFEDSYFRSMRIRFAMQLNSLVDFISLKCNRIKLTEKRINKYSNLVALVVSIAFFWSALLFTANCYDYLTYYKPRHHITNGHHRSWWLPLLHWYYLAMYIRRKWQQSKKEFNHLVVVCWWFHLFSQEGTTLIMYFPCSLT